MKSAAARAGVEKVLFVVDRKDLDYQTMREYDRFEKGAANSNTSTRVLKKQLEDPGARIIITTIQKLASFIAANKGHAIYDGHVVIIFDECHRSQFGDMHTAITKAFKHYHLFGFTGTPIESGDKNTQAVIPALTGLECAAFDAAFVADLKTRTQAYEGTWVVTSSQVSDVETLKEAIAA